MEKLRKILRKSQKDFSRLPKKQQLLIISVLIFLFLLSLSLPTGYSKLSYRIIQSNTAALATPTPAPVIPAIISVSLDKQTVSKGEEFSAMISLNSPSHGIEAADIILRFDPKFLKAEIIEEGSYFPLYPSKTIGEGFVKFSGMADLQGKKFIIPKGKGVVASISFTALENVEFAKILIDKNYTILASAGENILNKNTPMDVSVKIGQANL